MSKLFIEEQELHQREDDIIELLKLISDSNVPVKCKSRRSSYSCKIDAYSGPFTDADLRFETASQDYTAQYFEVWNKSNLNRWRLKQAYLHVYRTDTLEEVLCLHCDPLEDPTSPHYYNKRGPHLHLSWLPSPLSHSHIPLDRTYIKNVLGNIKNLTTSYKNALDIAWNEILIPLAQS